MIPASPISETRRRRAWLARGIVVVATVSLVVGIWVDHRQSRSADPWRARLLRGEPVDLQFLCGASAPVDCKATVRMTYRKEDSGWCARLQTNVRGDDAAKSWCNADPGHGTISIFGVVYSFDRFGLVKINDRLVGRMLAS